MNRHPFLSDRRMPLSAFCLVLLLSTNAQAQDALYIPRNVQHAIKNGTRSPDGRPGPRYWQNTGRYNITLSALPPDRTIRGSEQITYINNSPDTLPDITMRFIENIHRPGAVRYGDADPDYLNAGLQVDSWSENGKSRTWTDAGSHPTWQSVRLERPLLPHDSVRLTFDWHYQIALRSGREGMIDSTTFFLAYFYPRVSVYDDYNYWDQLDFVDYQEFYNDFNDYTLSVKTPKDYIVWATGDLLNPDEVLQPACAARFKQSLVTDSILHLATTADLSSHKVTARNAINTWKWKASDITDITVAISDHFVWDASSVIVDAATGRRASVQAAFNDTAMDFHRMVEFGRHSLDWFSRNWPGVSYPFPKTTIVQGYADMEYPMMVNDATTDSPEFSRFVAEHEIAHSWFPFYMGINESRYPFMDEGWATTFELLIMQEDLGKEKAEENYKQFRIFRWSLDRSSEEDLPIITPANVLRGVAYGENAYGKPSLGYLAVKELLGDAIFKKCLHAYMDRWHGKHPIPWDFFHSFNDVSGQNLNWFWTNWFFSNNYIDLAIGKVEKTTNGYLAGVRNIGGMAAPFDLEVRYADGSTGSFHQTPAVWSRDTKQTTVTLPARGGKKIVSVKIRNGIFMDADPSNNEWSAH